jgi:hypothetical protein
VVNQGDRYLGDVENRWLWIDEGAQEKKKGRMHTHVSGLVKPETERWGDCTACDLGLNFLQLPIIRTARSIATPAVPFRPSPVAGVGDKKGRVVWEGGRRAVRTPDVRDERTARARKCLLGPFRPVPGVSLIVDIGCRTSHRGGLSAHAKCLQEQFCCIKNIPRNAESCCERDWMRGRSINMARMRF